MVHYWFNTLYKKNEFNLLFISSLFFHFHLFWFPHINHGYVNKRALPLFFSFCFHIAWGENRLWPLLRMSGSSLPSQKERFYLSPICIHINKEAASPLLLISSASHTAQTHEFFQKLADVYTRKISLTPVDSLDLNLFSINTGTSLHQNFHPSSYLKHIDRLPVLLYVIRSLIAGLLQKITQRR